MRALWCAAGAAAVLLSVVGVGAVQTWTGQISDSLCQMKHDPGVEQSEVLTDPECVRACVRGGSKYVFISNDTVYQIANQDLPDLATYAAKTVRLSGEIKGTSITVSKVEPAGGGQD